MARVLKAPVLSCALPMVRSPGGVGIPQIVCQGQGKYFAICAAKIQNIGNNYPNISIIRKFMPSLLPSLDAVDRALLDALQKNGRATVGELAEQVSLSPSPCWRRVRQLEEAGLISGYHAHLDRNRAGYGGLGFVQDRKSV